ncbi:hypothetical protein TcG_00478, partial [Trypanosoma cruzi]
EGSGEFLISTALLKLEEILTATIFRQEAGKASMPNGKARAERTGARGERKRKQKKKKVGRGTAARRETLARFGHGGTRRAPGGEARRRTDARRPRVSERSAALFRGGNGAEESSGRLAGSRKRTENKRARENGLASCFGLFFSFRIENSVDH